MPITIDDERKNKVVSYLEADPSNVWLLLEAADICRQQGHMREATAFLERVTPSDNERPEVANLKGIMAIAEERFDDAVRLFSPLVASDESPALKFNLAWAHAMLGNHEDALALLGDDVMDQSPRAPGLRVQMHHHLGELEQGMEVGASLAERYPYNATLMGALATLALDADQAALADHYAQRAGDDAAGLAVQGIFALDQNDLPGAAALFDHALTLQPASGRAWVGKGLAHLASGKALDAAKAIDRGAELFGTHLGSWVASAWAYFAASDLVSARQRFEHAVTLDGNFSEPHGGLAVIDVLEGQIDDARRRTDIALRLDRNALGGQLAQTMLLERSGKPEMAARIREKALDMPVGPDGKTIGQTLAALAFRRS